MNRWILGATALVTAVLAQPAFAQTAPAPEHRLEDVVVEGNRLAERVERFVKDVIAAPVNRGPARWASPVCVGVANLNQEVARGIIDEVATVALRAGVEVSEPGCDPNVLIVATADGDATARALVERAPRAFIPAYSGGSRSRRQLEAFQSVDTPVRWWHTSIPVIRDTGEAAVRMPGRDAPLIPAPNSRIQTATRNDLRAAFIILDIDQASGLSVQQLGGYIGMVAMAQIDPDTDTAGYDSVLNLFRSDPTVEGVTPWDVSYLTALYDSELNRQHAVHQAGEIASMMTRDQRRQQAGTPED